MFGFFFFQVLNMYTLDLQKGLLNTLAPKSHEEIQVLELSFNIDGLPIYQ